MRRNYDRAIQHFSQNRYGKAKKFIGKILDRHPKNDAANSLLARIALKTKDFEAAKNVAIMVLENNPSYAEAYQILGSAYAQTGLFGKAEQNFRQGLALRKNDAEGHKGLGEVLRAIGRLIEAEKCFRNALDVRPDYPEAYCQLGLTLLDMGQYGAASVFFRNAATLQPTKGLYWVVWANCLAHVAFSETDELLFEDLLSLLDQPTVTPGPVAPSIISALRFDPGFARILKAVKSGELNHQTNCLEAAGILSTIPLFLRVMAISLISDLETEEMLQLLRRGILGAVVTMSYSTPSLALTAALAQLCFNNEYIFDETSEETAGLETLDRKIAKCLENNEDVPPVWLASLGSYRPLNSFPWASRLLDRKWPNEIAAVINQQVAEPLEEKSLRSKVLTLTSIKDTVSKAVLKQYEENPYPTWNRVDLCDHAQSLAEVLRDHDILLQNAENDLFRNPDVLIAGCGTGKQALNAASKYLHSRIMAVDLSLTSLAYAKRKSRELGFDDIEYVQGDILELAGLDRQFGIIECTGVLHHLGDPLAGWRKLLKILPAEGVMRIGLYSEEGRRSVKKAHAYLIDKGFITNVEDMRRCRRDIIRMAATDPAMMELVDTVDFFSLSGFRDMIFHAQEHCFTLPEIQKALDGLGLTFLGFELPTSDMARRFSETFPETQAMASLDCWHRFELENPDSFRGMYMFWVQKNPTGQAC